MKHHADRFHVFIGKNIYTVLFSTLLIVVLVSFIPTATAKKRAAQNEFSNTHNYAVLISQPNHLVAVINTAETITKNTVYNRNTFVVMSCGKSVESFIKGSQQKEVIEKGIAAGVTYKICGLSLKQMNINPDTIVDGIEIIPNGLTYMFDKQLEGYKTLEL